MNEADALDPATDHSAGLEAPPEWCFQVFVFWLVVAALLTVLHVQTLLPEPNLQAPARVATALVVIVGGSFFVIGSVCEVLRRPRWKRPKVAGWPALVVVAVFLYGVWSTPRDEPDADPRHKTVYTTFEDGPLCVGMSDSEGMWWASGSACESRRASELAVVRAHDLQLLRAISAVGVALALFAAFDIWDPRRRWQRTETADATSGSAGAFGSDPPTWRA